MLPGAERFDIKPPTRIHCTLIIRAVPIQDFYINPDKKLGVPSRTVSTVQLEGSPHADHGLQGSQDRNRQISRAQVRRKHKEFLKTMEKKGHDVTYSLRRYEKSVRNPETGKFDKLSVREANRALQAKCTKTSHFYSQVLLDAIVDKN